MRVFFFFSFLISIFYAKIRNALLKKINIFSVCNLALKLKYTILINSLY